MCLYPPASIRARLPSSHISRHAPDAASRTTPDHCDTHTRNRCSTHPPCHFTHAHRLVSFPTHAPPRFRHACDEAAVAGASAATYAHHPFMPQRTSALAPTSPQGHSVHVTVRPPQTLRDLYTDMDILVLSSLPPCNTVACQSHIVIS